MPAATIDPGTVYSKLTVLRDAGTVIEKCGRKNRLVECQCACGKISITRVMHLKSGKNKSCGCDKLNNRIRKHSLRARKADRSGASDLFRCWRGIIDRCTKPHCPGYPDYGGRGIQICERWWNSFDAFADDMGEMPEGMSIERKNNNGNYEPDNCRWATMLEQAQNRRNVLVVNFQGKSGSLLLVCRELGITSRAAYKRIWKKIKFGMEPNSAITTELGQSNKTTSS